MDLESSVSVIIPAYNAASYIHRALESALQQTHPPLEILVIDDGSADDTAEVVSAYPPPVRLLRQPNSGPAAARNRGAKEARGAWLAFLDSDDTWMPRKLERQLAAANDSGVGIVANPTVTTEHLFADAQGNRPPSSEIDFEALWRQNCLVTSSVLIRKAAFEKAGGFDTDLFCAEDYNLWLKIAHAGWKVLLLHERLCQWTPAEGNLTSQLERFLEQSLINADKIAARLQLDPDRVRRKKIAIYDEYGQDFLYQRQLRLARRCLFQALIQEPTAARLGKWLTAYCPPQALDMRRRVIRRLKPS